MAVSAIIFIECAHGKAIEAIEEIRKVGGVREAYAVTGNYDVITFVRASNFRVLGEVLIKKVQKVPGVLKTVTNVVIE